MNITFIGGGNMASALISGLLQQGFAAEQLQVVEINAESREKLKLEFGVWATHDLADGIAKSDVVLLSVKPQQLYELAQELAPLLRDQLMISIAAGIRASDIMRWLGDYGRVVRAMPSTPSLVRLGVTGLYATSSVNEQDRRNAESILAAVGSTLWVEEEEMLHAVTAISGSGPAYVFYFIESMQQAGIELGLTPIQARQLSLQTFVGASKLASMSDEDVVTLRARVSSKGGTTELAIQAMEESDIKCKIMAAIHAASVRSHEMSDEFGRK
ncbi:pyrroline-5-carboxylate reductase [Nitrosomonas supralitoralis]|uniref:Pyrroline-5-carboxylate reductase n=1 Tax=Nitrosomonas supralitoralis TaxID=2116706 RepID=A0A2P7NS89_9PROT|nr:pyrroline-5-carboxylate reductase [Nitrosomonas supralitoralis]PSJ16327.1 pyrroline-5-carboxylate reductase [Nitrosomonas supralitoralis]